jgi:hypothetical protein
VLRAVLSLGAHPSAAPGAQLSTCSAHSLAMARTPRTRRRCGGS